MCAQGRRCAKGHTPIAGTKARVCAEAASRREPAPRPCTLDAHCVGVRTDPAPWARGALPHGGELEEGGAAGTGGHVVIPGTGSVGRGAAQSVGGTVVGASAGRGWLQPSAHTLLHRRSDPSRVGSAAPRGAPALGLPSPGTQRQRAHAPGPREMVSSPWGMGWAAATCSRTRCEEELCGGLAASGVRVTAQGQGP